MGRLVNVAVSPKSMNFATGTWTYNAGSSSTPEFQSKAATAETTTVTIPIYPGQYTDSIGGKLNKVTVPLFVGTADLAAVVAGTLYQHNVWKAQPVPVFTFTATVGTQLLTAAAGTILPPVGSAVQLSAGTSLPTGFATSTTYYVGSVNQAASTYQLFATQQAAIAGSTPVAFTSAGVGTLTSTATAIDTVAIASGAYTETGAQVTNSSVIRRYEYALNTPTFTNTSAPYLQDIVTYTLSLSIQAASTTILRVYAANAVVEMPTLG